MGLFDKLGNKTINELMESAKEGVKDTSRKVKASLGDVSQEMKEQSNKRKASKAPVEGAIERYAVVYNGGLTQYPKKMTGEIGLNILEDSFYLKPTYVTEDWFEDMAISYKNIENIQIVKRKVTNAEVLLSSGGSDMKSLEQENTIEITYMDAEDKKQVVRFEMLTGTTVYAQAGKCVEFMDVLRQNNVLGYFRKENSKEQNSEDALAQLEKLSKLHAQGILTDDEFNAKKLELLSKI